MAKQDTKQSASVRGEIRTTGTGSELFRCRHEDGCEAEGRAEEMYNTSCDPLTTPREKLLAKVRCAAHAAKIAEKNGKGLRAPGCGVYPLCRTLKKMEEVESINAKRADMIRWVEGKKAEQAAANRDAEKQQRIEEARFARQSAVRDYASRYAEAPVAGPSVVRLPTQRFLADERETMTCGLPIACCRHDRPAERFITSMGEVVGVCRLAAAVFTEVFKQHENDKRYRKLLSTGDWEQAARFAADWCGEIIVEGDGRKK